MARARFSLALALLAAFLAQQSVAQGVEFHDLAFDQAAERAAAENKLVFVDFFTTWCAPCKEMDATTFQDPEVADWLAEHTVALKVDAEANETNEALAKRFGVRSFPNYVFIAPDGKLMDRIAGKRSPEEFIAVGGSVLRGENAVDRARSALATGDPNDPMLRSRLADAYVEMGQDEDALEGYLWCFDEGEKHRKSYHGVRLSFLLSTIERLGRRYPPAREALVERRQVAEQRIVDGSAEYEDIAVYSSINRVFNDQEATLALYDRVKDEGSLDDVTLFSFKNTCFDLLVDAKRYEEIVAEYDVSGRVDQEFDSYRWSMETYRDFDALLDLANEEIAESMRKEVEKLAKDELLQNQMRQSAKDMLRRGVASSYQVLIGAGRLDEATAVAQRLTEELDDAESHYALAWAGYLTGAPVEANLTQARRAFEMTGGEDISIVDTLGRVLATMGHRDEAILVAEEGLAKATTTRDRRTMAACLEYCRKQPAG
ncbi:MAG: thioredoxin fold domain-containing protein [Gammaproteobacteria bacterium]|nr:thioredoxin fold domain-containing protein [Gammaproteobacteria bacterium]